MYFLSNEHLYLYKQCRLWWNAALCCISSGLHCLQKSSLNGVSWIQRVNHPFHSADCTYVHCTLMSTYVVCIQFYRDGNAPNYCCVEGLLGCPSKHTEMLIWISLERVFLEYKTLRRPSFFAPILVFILLVSLENSEVGLNWLQCVSQVSFSLIYCVHRASILKLF